MIPTGAARVAGVAGWPIAHSLSPALMGRWIQAAGIDALYAPFAIAPGMARQVFTALAKTGLSGLNVTLPYKEDALAVADECSEAARTIGAANLLTFRDGRIHADNTDAAGFLTSLKQANIDPSGHRVLVLGAGGASRAILHAVKTAGAADIGLSNRTRAKAQALADEFGQGVRVVDWGSWQDCLSGTDLVINATSMGMKGLAPISADWSRAPSECAVADIVYTPLDTDFLIGARAAGLKTVDGLGMLIGQARLGFRAFFDRDAPDGPDDRAFLISCLDGRP